MAYQCYLHNLIPFKETRDENETDILNENDSKEKQLKLDWNETAKEFLTKWINKRKTNIRFLSKIGDTYHGIDVVISTRSDVAKKFETSFSYKSKIASNVLSEVLLKNKLAMLENNDMQNEFFKSVDLIGKMPKYVSMKALHVEENLNGK